MSTDSGAKFLDAVIGMTLFFLVTAPLVVLMTVFACDTIWGWYLAPTHGAGPSQREWFGIALLWEALRSHTSPKRDDEESVIIFMLKHTAKNGVRMGVLLVMAAIIRWMAGWQ